MSMFTDNAIDSKDKDTFGFATYVDVLEEVILQATSLPFCLGVFGPWGSGKTSFMQMLKGSLQDKNVPTIWFDPWKYDQKEDLWHALILTILSEIANHSKDSKVEEAIAGLAKTVGLMTLKKAVTALTSGLITNENVDAVVKIFDKTDIHYYRNINHFEEDFAFVVGHYSNNDRLVIFIDDLDRCLPENAITVLESLKLFLNNEYCIFVLGMDHDIVAEGIKHRYAGKLSMNGREYLDKIIQIPFFLPQVPDEMLKTSLSINSNFSKEIWDMVQLAMNGNPRKTKRFINSFSLIQRFLNHPGPGIAERLQDGRLAKLSQEEQNMYLAKILIFEMNFPDFYLHLQHFPGDWEYVEDKVIPEYNGAKRKQILTDNEGRLVDFWEKTDFQAFMIKTLMRSFGYSVPGEEIVKLLLRATNLVTEVPNP